jgi:hypothetical protein
MDDRFHAANSVDLIRDASGLGTATEIADDDPCGTRRELAEGPRAIRRSGVQHHLMTAIKKRLGRRASEPVGASSDEHERHSILPVVSEP